MRLGWHDVEIKTESKVNQYYDNTLIRERFRHRWECNHEYLQQLEEHGLIFSGKAVGQEIMQILELKGHPFFIGTQFHPEYLSRPLQPHPLYINFLKVALSNLPKSLYRPPCSAELDETQVASNL